MCSITKNSVRYHLDWWELRMWEIIKKKCTHQMHTKHNQKGKKIPLMFDFSSLHFYCYHKMYTPKQTHINTLSAAFHLLVPILFRCFCLYSFATFCWKKNVYLITILLELQGQSQVCYCALMYTKMDFSWKLSVVLVFLGRCV